MIIGLVKETMTDEYRVGLTPANVKEYVENGHDVLVEDGAGEGAGFMNGEYRRAQAEIVPNKKDIYNRADMIIKVKEPEPAEYGLMKQEQILFGYLHLAANPDLTATLLKKKVKAIGYETIVDEQHNLPCLAPMSKIAGRLSVQEGARHLQNSSGGRGVLLGGIPGIHRGRVVIIGAGQVGMAACKMAVGMAANVTILDVNQDRLTYLDDIFGSKITTLVSNRQNLLYAIEEADLVIGAVLIPGATAPKLLKRNDLRRMKPRAVLVDVAIDQGGCFETSRPTTHTEPTYIEEDILHYCVSNMPGVVSCSATEALTSTTIEFGLEIANKGLEKAVEENASVLAGLNTYKGKCVHQAIADSLNLKFTPFKSIQ